MTDDYSKMPQTLGERRASKTDAAKDWSPRDALISTLRDIGSGARAPESIVIAMLDRDEDGTAVSTVMATPTIEAAIGMIEIAKFQLMQD